MTITLFFCKSWATAPKGEIYCLDGQAFHEVTNDAGGSEFLNLPTLVLTDSGGWPYSQTYQVSWRNTDNNPARLNHWFTRSLDSYTEGDIVDMGRFDISAVKLLAPASGVVVDFPVTFRWQRRSASPTDSYRPCIYGGFFPPPPIPPDMFGCNDPPLGYVDRFVLQRPPLFSIDIDYEYEYFWNVEVFDDIGGSGTIYRYRHPYFYFAEP
jgi:hypothetical protein